MYLVRSFFVSYLNFGWAKPELGYKEPSNHTIRVKKYGLCLCY